MPDVARGKNVVEKRTGRVVARTKSKKNAKTVARIRNEYRKGKNKK